MPGWAGQPERRADGAQEYAWHCAPFTEGAQYGIEVFYPHHNELRVSRKNDKLIFDGDFGPPPESGGDLMWPPFRSFGRDYYTYQLLLDLKVEKDWAVRTEPHPRFYTDATDTVPIAVPALLRTEWWLCGGRTSNNKLVTQNRSATLHAELKARDRRFVGRLQIGRRRDAQIFSWHLDLRDFLCRNWPDRNFLSRRRSWHCHLQRRLWHRRHRRARIAALK